MKIIDYLNIVRNNNASAFFYTPPLYAHAVSYFFNKPIDTIYANDKNELSALFDRIDDYKNKGFIAYGYVKYETGYLLETGLNKLFDSFSVSPVAKFCIFDRNNITEIKSKDLDFSGSEDQFPVSGFQPPASNFQLLNFSLNTTERDFISALSQIKEYIASGDTYQINYTLKSSYDFSGDIVSLFLSLIFSQSAQYTAFINDDDNYILSLSPELFFMRNGSVITSKPMKGTMKRGYNLSEDNKLCTLLAESEKNRAENVMIVDLMRNDLTRMPSSSEVWVSSMFDIEKYESLFQLISSVCAKTGTPPALKEIFSSIFPCGSVTGAPKYKTMQLIRNLEHSSRGIYTGALGIVSREKDIFNVPIRTLIINKHSGKGEMGLGSGIVWDSSPEDEYDEVLLKGRFLSQRKPYFELFETMLIENGLPVFFSEHLQRLKSAAEYFLFYYDEDKIKNSMMNSLNSLDKQTKYILRLCLSKWGKISIQTSPFRPPASSFKFNIILSEHRVNSTDTFLYFKTSQRELYDRELKSYDLRLKTKDFFDVIFFNEKGQLTEGARTNIFILKNGKWFTPPVSCGLLNGIARQHFIDSHPDVIETLLYKDDILSADTIILTNSVRGEMKVYNIISE